MSKIYKINTIDNTISVIPSNISSIYYEERNIGRIGIDRGININGSFVPISKNIRDSFVSDLKKAEIYEHIRNILKIIED